MCVCDKIDWMENGWMDWIEWMSKVDGKWLWKVDCGCGKWKVARFRISHMQKWLVANVHFCVKIWRILTHELA